MRIKPLPPDTLTPEVRYVHDEIAGLIGRSQSQVNMLDSAGAHPETANTEAPAVLVLKKPFTLKVFHEIIRRHLAL